MWSSAWGSPQSLSSSSSSLRYCRNHMVDLSLDSSPPSWRFQQGSWSPCTDPPAGPAGWNFPWRSLAGCWYQALPSAPPTIIKLLNFDAVTLPCWMLLWGRVQGAVWRHQPSFVILCHFLVQSLGIVWVQPYLTNKFGNFCWQLPALLLHSFPNDNSVTIKNVQWNYESALSDGCVFLWKKSSLWVFPAGSLSKTVLNSWYTKI